MRTLYFSLPLHAADFLRPCEITTDVFGGLWGQLTAERVQQLPGSSNTSVQQVTSRVVDLLHIHSVQVKWMAQLVVAACMHHFTCPPYLIAALAHSLHFIAASPHRLLSMHVLSPLSTHCFLSPSETSRSNIPSNTPLWGFMLCRLSTTSRSSAARFCRMPEHAAWCTPRCPDRT